MSLGAGGLGAVLLTVYELLSGYNGYFLRSWEFRQKSKDSKKCYLIQFLHIFLWADFVLISSDFRRLWACEGLRELYITPISVDCSIWASFGEVSSVLSACFSVLPAVLRLLVGVDSVRFRQAVRWSAIYMYIRFGILCHMLIFSIYLLYSLEYS